MPRVMTSGMLTAITSPIIRPALFAELHFANEVLYVWSGTGSVVWSGQTWLGLGTFGSISVIEEGTSLEARGITLTLSGINPQALAEALQNVQIALPVILYLGMFDASFALIANPLVAWKGRMDQPIIKLGADTVMISLQCESRLLDMDISVDRRYTLEDSVIDNPLDLGFQFVTAIQEFTILFGTTAQAQSNI